MRESLDRPMLERIAAEGASGRALVVNTTNIDLGDSHPWDIIAEARAELAGGNPGRVQSILLASAGIPAVFPAREIGTFLYVDGAITGNILYGGRIEEQDSLAVLWRKRNPSAPLPKLRYWVIFNNQFRFPPQVTAQKWPDIMSRATIMATQTGTVSAMRHLFARAELMKLKQKVDIEVRVMAVPDSFVPSVPGTFQNEVMNALADLGEKMGPTPQAGATRRRTDPRRCGPMAFGPIGGRMGTRQNHRSSGSRKGAAMPLLSRAASFLLAGTLAAGCSKEPPPPQQRPAPQVTS
jgi:hypothetical protein